MFYLPVLVLARYSGAATAEDGDENSTYQASVIATSLLILCTGGCLLDCLLVCSVCDMAQSVTTGRETMREQHKGPISPSMSTTK